jgi:hypothetical protein
MKISGLALGIGAFVSGAVSVSCWLLLELGGGFTRTGARDAAFLMWACATGFLACVIGAAYVRGPTDTRNPIWHRVLLVIGWLGLSVLGLFIVVSKGAVLELPEIDWLLLSFVCFVVFFRSKKQTA